MLILFVDSKKLMTVCGQKRASKKQVVLLSKKDVELSKVRSIVNDAGFTMLSFDIGS